MRCDKCFGPTKILGESYYCRERMLAGQCEDCSYVTLRHHSAIKEFFLDLWDMMSGVPLRQNYFSKCKRIRSDGPTPCWCCIGECWGDKLDKR